jgi:hypothetical protein
LYIALFVHFIPPGVLEAIYIIEALLKNRYKVQPDTVLADTQGQSTPVFAFTYLLGIELMPRIRNWKDLIFFRPSNHRLEARPTPLLFLSLPFHGPRFGAPSTAKVSRSTALLICERWWDEGVIYRKEWALWHREQAHFTS